jgi:Aspartyl protease
MCIDGEWALFDDGVERSILAGDIKAGNEAWIKVPFLVDTGADRTVFSAAALARLGLQSIIAQDSISGLGGLAASVLVTTQLRLTREDAGKVVFRGQYAAVTVLEALDISVLGRDIMGLFVVIVDKPRNVVCLLGQRHRYTIEQD